MKTLSVVGICAALVVGSANASWSIRDIGASSGATAISDSGQITGTATNDISDLSSYYIYITDTNGANLRNIGSFANPSFVPDDININGQVVGSYINIIESNIRSFITGPNGSNITDFGTFNGTDAWITGINDSGAVTGVYWSAESGHRSFVTDANNINIRDIGTLAESITVATSINNSGQVVGYSSLSQDKQHAFITDSNGANMRDIGTLGKGLFKSSIANDINESGQVAGYSSMNLNAYYAFITGEDGAGMINLGTLSGSSVSIIHAINDIGQAVGIAADRKGDNIRSFIYADGGLTDLSTLPELVNAGWHDIHVTDINNNGQVVGWGYLNDDELSHSFLLSFTSDTVFTPEPLFIPAIPEPSTYLMLLAGLGLLGFVGSRNLLKTNV